MRNHQIYSLQIAESFLENSYSARFSSTVFSFFFPSPPGAPALFQSEKSSLFDYNYFLARLKLKFLLNITILDHYLWVWMAVKGVELFVNIGVGIERRHPLPQGLLILIKIKVIFVSKCCLRSPRRYKLFPRPVSINFTPKTFD